MRKARNEEGCVLRKTSTFIVVMGPWGLLSNSMTLLSNSRTLKENFSNK